MRNIIFCMCAIALITLNSCQEREGCTDPNAVNYDVLAQSEDNSCTFPNVQLRFVPTIVVGEDTGRLGFGQDYDINGLNVRFDQIRFYVDDITLVTSKENFESETIVLATEADKSHDIGELKVADLQELKFSVGVNSTRNHIAPELQPMNSPLFDNDSSSENWDEDDGYIFFKIEGAVDVNGDGVYEQDMSEIMSIHCGLDDNLKTVTLPVTEQSINRVGYELTVEVDVRGIFTDYDLPNKLFTRPDTIPQPGIEIMNNVENIFSIKE